MRRKNVVWCWKGWIHVPWEENNRQYSTPYILTLPSICKFDNPLYANIPLYIFHTKWWMAFLCSQLKTVLCINFFVFGFRYRVKPRIRLSHHGLVLRVGSRAPNGYLLPSQEHWNQVWLQRIIKRLSLAWVRVIISIRLLHCLYTTNSNHVVTMHDERLFIACVTWQL